MFVAPLSRKDFRAQSWIASALILALFAFLIPNPAIAVNDLSFPQDATLILPSDASQYTVISGSVVDDLTVNTSTFVITISVGGTFTLRSPDKKILTNTAGAAISCSSSNAYSEIVIDSQPNGTTVTITPSGTCSPPSGGSTVPADTTPPSNPSVVINGGDATTQTQNVTLTLSAGDAAWVEVSEDAALSGAPQVKYTGVAVPMTIAFTLSQGEGTKTVYVRFMDEAGNFSVIVLDSIVFGATADVPSEETPKEEPPPTVATPESTAVADGDLIRVSNTPEVYITKKVGIRVIIRHIVTAAIFDIYGHFGGDAAWGTVRGVDTLGTVLVSAWVRGSDGKVFEVNGDGSRHHMNMTWEEFATRVGAGDSQLATDLIFEVNDAEIGLYVPGPDVL